MERSDIQKHVFDYATSCTKPFTTAHAFEAIDAIETQKQVSDALGRLYNQRILARRKVDKVRYEYIISEKRPAGFEMAQEQPAAEQKTTESDKPAIKNNIGSAESAITGLHRIAELTTSCQPLKEPDTPEKPAEPTQVQEQKQQDWLKTAHDIVHGDREKTYGDPGKNLRLIAQYWSTHTGIIITETDVCIMMMLLKIARLKNNPGHDDSWIDIAGYTALKNKLDNACKPKANS